MEEKIFISHASADDKYVCLFKNLLISIGIKENQIFYTSDRDTGVELRNDIIDEIYAQYHNYDLRIYMMLSNNYYKSPVCMNEMGATWIMDCNYMFILLPGFNYNNISGVINKNKVGLKLDDNINDVTKGLDQEYENLKKEFGLLDDSEWCNKRDEFINGVLREYRRRPTVAIKKSPI